MKLEGVANGWVQWDWQLKTYIGVVDGQSPVVHGGKYLTPISWANAAGITLTPEEADTLARERDESLGDGIGQEPVVLSPVDFLGLMTDAELAAILAAADSSYTIRAWLYKFERARMVSRVNPETVAGIEALHSAGLLSTATRNTILDGR